MKRPIFFLGLASAGCWLAFGGALALRAQEPQQPAAPSSLLQPLVAEELPPAEQTRLVRSLYEQTKSARTARDYSRFLDDCAQALGDGLNEKNRKYVVSLQGWGLNRRGLARWELAEQLRSIDNQAGAEAALAQALADLDAAVATDPNRHRSWNSRGLVRVAAGQLREAVGDFTRAIEIKADDTTAIFNRAETCYQLQKYGLAEADYTTVLRLNPDDAQARTGRGLARLADGRTQAALEDLEAVAERFPQQPAALINRGDARQQAAQWELAAADYRAAIERGAQDPGAQRLAWLLATCPEESLYDPAQALELIQGLATAEDPRMEYRETLAAARAAAGEFDAAQRTQSAAIELAGAELAEDHPARVRLTLYESQQPYRQSQPSAEPENGETEPSSAVPPVSDQRR